MTFPVVGSNIPSVYQIDNSLRFNEADTSYLSTTFSSAGNRKTFTWSGWIKKGNNDDSGYQSIFTAKAVSNGNDGLFLYQNKISISWDFDDTGQEIRSSAVFRDNSAWYHIVYAVDTTLATASDRIRIYVNGVEVALDSTVGQNEDGGINKNDIHSIGVWNTGTSTNHLFDGYMAECHFIDGQQLSPTDFGEFDEDSGIWKPKQYAGTYGTNGFYLKFNNTGNMGEDSSGNDNTFTPTNLSGTTDVTTDTPTNNWVVVNNLDKGQSNASYMMNLSEGNLKISGEAESSSARASGFIMSAGKWYWEVCLVSAGIFQVVGIDASNSDLTTEGTGLDANSIGYFSHTGLTRRGGTATTSGATWTTTGDIIGIAYDGDNGTLNFYKNNSLQSNNYTGLTEDFWMPSFASRNGSMVVNFGQDGSFAGNKTAQGNADGNGYGDFYYAPPSGYLALCTQNLATELSPTIDDGSQYFNSLIYTGDGNNGRTVTGLGFQSDWTWIKSRNRGDVDHILNDSTRGAGKNIYSNDNYSEDTSTNKIVSFDSDGLTLNSHISVNGSSDTYVAWNWLANGGTTSSNTDGSITSTVQANTTAGFSIVTYTGTGSQATVGHGLGITPKMIIWKRRDSGIDWSVQGTQSGMDTDRTELTLNNTGAISAVDSRLGRQSQWSSTTFEVNTYTAQNASGGTYVAYCFAEIEGYSKFGSYEANNSTDGTFVYTGFKPSLLILKAIDQTGNWFIFDNKRDTDNAVSQILYPDSTATEGSASVLDFLSNGVKLRNSGSGGINYSGTYIYMAFAEHPFVTSGAVPVTAR